MPRISAAIAQTMRNDVPLQIDKSNAVMLLIEEILVSDDLIQSFFMCNLEACKGACCHKGDFGAPLEAGEIDTLHALVPFFTTYLPAENARDIQKYGISRYYPENAETGTPLMDDGRCVFMIRSGGIAMCGIEKAYLEGKIPFRKPVSCHLYPVRIDKNTQTGFEALNYDRWDICTPACALGKSKAMPLFVFVKAGIIRKYGPDFYEALEAAYHDLYT